MKRVIRLNHTVSTINDITHGTVASGYVAPSSTMHNDATIVEFFQYIMVLKTTAFSLLTCNLLINSTMVVLTTQILNTHATRIHMDVPTCSRM